MKLLIKKITYLVIFCTLIYLNLLKLNNVFLGCILLFIYLFILSSWIKPVLTKLFDFSSSAWRTRIFAVFLVFVTLGFIGGIFVLLTSLTTFTITVIFLINGLSWLGFNYWLDKNKNFEGKPKKYKTDNIIEQAPKAKIGVLFYFILFFIGIDLLILSKTGDTLLSPWQTISSYYIYIFFIGTLILGWLIFSNLNTKTIIFLLLLHCFWLHSYLPLTHKFLYGADQWRHMAIEQKLLQEKKVNIVSFDKNPKTFVQTLNPGKLTYNNFWASKVIITKMLKIDLLTLNKWFGPLIFSLLLPLLLFEIAKLFNSTDKQAVFFVWLSFLFFPLTSLGSMTLPVSYGFLIWLMMIILLLKRLLKPKWPQLILLGFLTILSVFAYSLYLILFVLVWSVGEIIIKASILANNEPLPVPRAQGIGSSRAKKPLQQDRRVFNLLARPDLVGISLRCVNKKKWVLSVLAPLLLLVSIFLPLLEFLTKYSYFNSKINIFSQIKQFLGNITGIYLVLGPRPHDILGGNIVFNQAPSFAFVANLLTSWKLWIPVFMILLWLLALYGLIIIFKNKKIQFIWLSITSIGLWFSYFIGFYLLSGNRILSRRLDMILSLLTLLLVFIGLKQLVLNKQKYSINKVIIIILIFSLAITTSYSLGPDTKTVSASQYQAMDYVWSQIKNDKNYCIIANTYPLLVLEYFSAQKIIGGGFPIDENFYQPAKIELLNEISHAPSAKSWQKAAKITSSSQCWYVGQESSLKNNAFYRQNLVSVKRFADTIVWGYNINN